MSDAGITGSISHFCDTVTRVYANNVLFCVLQGDITCIYKNNSYKLTAGDILFICEGVSVEINSENAYALLFLFRMQV